MPHALNSCTLWGVRVEYIDLVSLDVPHALNSCTVWGVRVEYIDLGSLKIYNHSISLRVPAYHRDTQPFVLSVCLRSVWISRNSVAMGYSCALDMATHCAAMVPCASM